MLSPMSKPALITAFSKTICIGRSLLRVLCFIAKPFDKSLLEGLHCEKLFLSTLPASLATAQIIGIPFTWSVLSSSLNQPL